MSFVCDAMLGRVSKFLRIFGYDVLYDNEYSDPELLKIASEENRILLTRDIALHQQALKLNISSILLLEKTYIERIIALVQQMDLDLNLDATNSRCATCNAVIIPIEKEKVKGKIPDRTYEVYEEFWVCSNSSCGKIYYEGPHWDNIQKIYNQIKKTIKIQNKSEILENNE